MNILVPMAITATVLVVGGSLAWGWPGIWVLAALFPAVIVGGTIGHFRTARQGLVEMRPGLLAIGMVMGFGGIIVSGALFSAAAASEWVDVAETRSVKYTPAKVWRLASDLETMPRWSAFLTDTEAIGTLTEKRVGDRYQITMSLDGRKVPGEIELSTWSAEKHLSMVFKLQKGTKISQLSHTISLQKTATGTDITIGFRYHVPTVIGRAFNTFVVKPLFKGLATTSMAHLVKALDD